MKKSKRKIQKHPKPCPTPEASAPRSFFNDLYFTGYYEALKLTHVNEHDAMQVSLSLNLKGSADVRVTLIKGDDQAGDKDEFFAIHGREFAEFMIRAGKQILEVMDAQKAEVRS